MKVLISAYRDTPSWTIRTIQEQALSQFGLTFSQIADGHSITRTLLQPHLVERSRRPALPGPIALT